jgi:hypothetical protein
LSIPEEEVISSNSFEFSMEKFLPSLVSHKFVSYHEQESKPIDQNLNKETKQDELQEGDHGHKHVLRGGTVLTMNSLLGFVDISGLVFFSSLALFRSSTE